MPSIAVGVDGKTCFAAFGGLVAPLFGGSGSTFSTMPATLGANAGPGVYLARIELLPCVRLDVLRIAVPRWSVTVPRVVAPSRNVTEPIGGPPPGVRFRAVGAELHTRSVSLQRPPSPAAPGTTALERGEI
jgi:hypothetical protein